MKVCSRCSKEFECMAGEIGRCHCSVVNLTSDELKFLKEHFNDCLCSSCLKEIPQLLIRPSSD